ncbi:MAG: YbaN family protein [Acidimicrobiia bacterium]
MRGIYFTLGLICLGGAYISFLPGIPTFDLVMLAAFFFARSSDKFHDWLINHKVFGRIIAAYRGGGLTMRTKAVAAVGIVASLSFSAVVLMDNRILRTVLALVGVYALWFVFSRPTRDPGTEAPGFAETSQPPETA